MTQRSLHLNINGLGNISASWRLSEDPIEFLDLAVWERLGRIAERGLLDAVFLADALGSTSYAKPWQPYDPFFPLTAIARVTERVGLVATVSSTFREPYDIARLGSSLDFASAGRAALNVVTTQYDAAGAQYGREGLPDREERYGRAEETVSVVKELWDSWAPDALLADVASGTFVDLDKVQTVDYAGRHVRVRGRALFPRSPQGRPVLLQAGGSPQGVELAAKHADAVFCVAHSLADGQEFYRTVKSRARAYGRREEELLVLPGLGLVLGSTEAEARSKRARLEELETGNDPLAGLVGLAGRLAVPVEALELDAPLPWHLFDRPDWAPRSVGFASATLSVARRGNLTVRELLARDANVHRRLCGTPEQVADSIEEWFRGYAADGFNLSVDTFPEGLDAMVDHLVPELQRRGIFRREYAATTLRGNLGLVEPHIGAALT